MGTNHRPGPRLPISVSVGEIDQSYRHREPHYDWRASANRVFDRWYGNPMGVVEIGPDIAVLNYGWSWEPRYNRQAIEAAENIFDSYKGHRIRILNAYESEPPHDFLEQFDFALVHTAHAWPRAVCTSEKFRDCHIDWVLPAGRYNVTGGTIVGQWNSDDDKWTVLTVNADAPPNAFHELVARRISP